MALADTAQIVQYMQAAVDIVLSSEHDINKVAACAFHPAHPEFAPAASINVRPDVLKAHFPWDLRIGSSSQFIHAELAALFRFSGPLRGAHICVTDPFCPNCAKNLAEAGVRAIYIDHKGFQKDFIARNDDEFKNMSMLIAEKAGISVYEVNRKAGTVTPILEQAAVTRPSLSAVEFYDAQAGLTFEDAARSFRQRLGARETWATAFIREADGSTKGMLAFEALPPGITPEDYKIRGTDMGKYRFPIDPLVRLLINARQLGCAIADRRVACARIPSSRALVNAVGMGISAVLLASATPDHDPTAQAALRMLADKQILNVTEL